MHTVWGQILLCMIFSLLWHQHNNSPIWKDHEIDDISVSTTHQVVLRSHHVVPLNPFINGICIWLADTAPKKYCSHLFWLQRCIQHSWHIKQTTQQTTTFKKYCNLSFWRISFICTEDMELQVSHDIWALSLDFTYIRKPRTCNFQYCYCYLWSGYLRNCKTAVSWVSGLGCSKNRHQTHQQK